MTLNDKAKTPILRFKEFQGEWKKIKLEDVLEYEQPTKYLTNNIVNTGDIPVLTANKSFILGYTLEQQGIYDASKSPVIIFDDFTTSTQFVKFKFKLKSSAIKILNPRKTSNVDLFFVFNLMKLIKFSQGTEHKRYWISEYSKLRVHLPSLPEQRKIASFFSTLDDLIDNLKQQKQKLEEYKKGLMQKLFPKKGQKVPELRFEGFEGEWKEVRLGEVVKKAKAGGTPLRSKKDFYQPSEIPFIKIEDITSANKYVNSALTYISKKGLENSSAWLLPAGNLLLSIYASYGKVAINKIPIAFNQAIMGIIVDSAKVLLDYIYYFLVYNQRLFKRLIKQGTQPNLTKEDIINIPLLIPSLPEQQKIAQLLSNLDNMIQLKQEQIDKMEEFKKGLMQRMFV